MDPLFFIPLPLLIKRLAFCQSNVLAFLLLAPGCNEVGLCRHIAQCGLWSYCHPAGHGCGCPVHLFVLFSDYTNSSTTAFQVGVAKAFEPVCHTLVWCYFLVPSPLASCGGIALEQPSSHCACSQWVMLLPTSASCHQSHHLRCQDQTDQNPGASYV